MSRLPRVAYSVTPSAGPWLAGASLLLLTADVSGSLLWRYHSELAALFPFDGCRFLLLLAALAILLLSRQVHRADVGLTLGSPRVTLLWVAFPLALVATIWLGLMAILILLARSLG